MNNKKKSQILLKVPDKVYEEYSNVRDYLSTSMEDICREENVSPYQLFSSFFAFLFAVVFIVIYGWLCCTTPNRKFKKMLLIIGYKHSEKSDKK